MTRKLPCALLLAGSTLAAQAAPGTGAAGKAEPAYIDSYRNSGIDDGLPQASVNALLQGHDGYLWIGTYGGLARFGVPRGLVDT